MFPIVVDSMAVVVISVGGCGWKKYKNCQKIACTLALASGKWLEVMREGSRWFYVGTIN